MLGFCPQFMDYESFVSLSDDDLARRDLAELNLRLAQDLPGADGLDVPVHLARLDEWASRIRSRTQVVWEQAAHYRTTHGYSTAQFRMLVLVSVLQQYLEVRYRLQYMEGDLDDRDSRTAFLHGPMSDFGGTCNTMPILYVAIGRRLGYPLHLVGTWEHWFVRWDDGRSERFNIEATARGFLIRSDEHYGAWPRPMVEEQLVKGKFLRNLTRREELAAFHASRARCWEDNLRFDLAVTAYYWACQLNPQSLNLQAHWMISSMLYRLWYAGNWNSFLVDAGIPADCSVALPPFSSKLDRMLAPHAQKTLARILRIHQQPRIKYSETALAFMES